MSSLRARALVRLIARGPRRSTWSTAVRAFACHWRAVSMRVIDEADGGALAAGAGLGVAQRLLEVDQAQAVGLEELLSPVSA